MTNHLECEKVAPKEQCDAVDAIMLDRGWRPIGEYVTDMTGDGIAEILVHAIPFGCGSCHGQAVMVMQGEELLFDRAADDAEVSIRPPFPPTGFWLKEPVRIEGEGLCCPSAYLEARFEWDGETFSRPNTDQ